MSANKQQIGFPSGELGENSLRLEILYDCKDFLILQKPANFWWETPPTSPEGQAIVDSLRRQIKRGKPELAELGFSDGCATVFDLDMELEGVGIIVKTKEALSPLRDMFGSEKFTLEFEILVRSSIHETEFTCELPLVEMGKRRQPVGVSHTIGRKCKTEFKLLEKLGKKFQLWAATTHYLRMHQIRVHAKEMGLRIVGEKTYADEEDFFVSDLKRGYRPKEGREELPLNSSACIRMNKLSFEWKGQPIVIEYTRPKSWRGMLAQIAKSP